MKGGKQMDQKKIGSFLRELRNEKGITQEQAANEFGVAQRTVSRWETGSNMPDLSILIEIAEFYDVDIKEIIDDESKFISMDTLIVFVFNSDTLSSRGWDYVKDHNNVTQRYDLSLSNLRNLNWRIAFPPTEEMRNIKMWPPYGTYDSMGFPVR